MATHNELGKLGEKIAIDHLKKKGYFILEQNWYYQKSEVDIIAQKGNLLVAIEVKTRTSASLGDPQDFVNRKKIILLTKAIDHYVNSRALDVEVRFDIIAILKQKGNIDLEHLEDAFYHF
jgi:putative endonuclease